MSNADHLSSRLVMKENLPKKCVAEFYKSVQPMKAAIIRNYFCAADYLRLPKFP